MKYWKLLPVKLKMLNRKLAQRGQSLVEFVLLLTVIAGISYGFVALMNRNLARYWEHSVNLIVNDDPNIKTITLD